VQEKDETSVMAVTRKLIALRHAHSAIRSGRFLSLKLRPPLLGFERVDGGERIRCLFNLGRTARRCRLVGEGQLLFSSGKTDQAKAMLGPHASCWLQL
jgi:alpha-glucosidase